MRKSKFSKEDILKINNLYLSGILTEEIALEMGCSRRWIEKILRKTGVWISKKDRLKMLGYGNLISNEDGEKIKNLNALGSNYREISNFLKIPYSRVKNFGLQNNLKSNFKPEDYRKYWLDDRWLDNIDMPEKAIYLGLFFSDGYNSADSVVTIQLWAKDKNYLERICRNFHGNVLYKAEDGFKSSFRSKRWSENLTRYGAVTKKSLILKWPNYLPISMEKYFIRGFFEGDGCIYKHNKNDLSTRCFVSITSTKEFLEKMSERLEFHLGIKSFIYKCRNYDDKNTFSLNIRKQSSVMKFCQWIYSDEIYWAMERKHEICRSFLENRTHDGKIILFRNRKD